MNEYIIHAKLKNNLLLSRILAGHKNLAAFCHANDLSKTEVGNFVNLKQPAVYLSSWRGGAEGEWTVAARRVAEALCIDPSELFSEEQRTVQLKANEAWIEMSRQQALSMVDPIQVIEASNFAETIIRDGGLTAKERMVINLRFGMGESEEMTLEQVAERLDLTRERIRQIESKALRKLRATASDLGMLEAPALAAPIFDPHSISEVASV